MENLSDKTAYSDHLNIPPPQPQGQDVPLDDANLARLVVRRPSVPGLMLATGILWVLAGTAYLALFSLWRLLQFPLGSSDFWLLLGVFFFIKDGVQLMRGKFRDPQADGIISVVVGLFFFGYGYCQFVETGGFGAIAVWTFFGAIFLIPGILVLIGRREYLAWLAEQKN